MLKQRAVKRQVRKECEEVFQPVLNVIIINCKQGSMMAVELDFERLINLHM
jgi:hypothetical protein